MLPIGHEAGAFIPGRGAGKAAAVEHRAGTPPLSNPGQKEPGTKNRSLDVAASELLLLPQRFRQNRPWIELKKIWRMKKKIKGFKINKIEGGYSVAIAGFIAFLPFKLKN
jgi:hypothetical protein